MHQTQFRGRPGLPCLAAEEAITVDAGTQRRKSKASTITLVYATRDEEHNGAVALKAFLEKHRP